MSPNVETPRGASPRRKGRSSCHGALLQGIAHNGPSLVGVGAGPVDFYLSTGRMPLDNPTDEPQRNPPRYNRAQMNALIAFITKVGGGPPSPAADPSQGDLAVGLHVFTDHCAGCHQVVARGGLVVGAFVPSLQRASALQIVRCLEQRGQRRASSAPAAASTRSSRHGAAATCTPTGNPPSLPTGTDIAGSPPNAIRCT